ncbi:hypothetical protein D3C79_877890 [compost metagenome]
MVTRFDHHAVAGNDRSNRWASSLYDGIVERRDEAEHTIRAKHRCVNQTGWIFLALILECARLARVLNVVLEHLQDFQGLCT